MTSRCRRRFNLRRVKVHRSYTVFEVAECIGAKRCTIRRWLKSGLPCCDDQRPYLISGKALRDFLQRRQTARRHVCGPGEVYCVACRRPVHPADGKVTYRPITDRTGDLAGVCPKCGHRIHRRVNVAKLPLIKRRPGRGSGERRSTIRRYSRPLRGCALERARRTG